MTQSVLVARVAGERIAIPAQLVQSVIQLGEVVSVPRAPGHIAGLTTLRSQSLTVIDSALALELEPQGDGHELALVTTIDGCGYAIAIDAVENVVDAMGEPEALSLKLAPGWKRCAVGKLETSVGAMLLIDLERLIAGPEQQKAA